MAAAFFVMLREGLEAALIVGILSGYLGRIGRRDALGRVWLGVIAAAALSFVAGVVVIVTIGELPEAVSATLEATAALLAVGVVTWMLFWMRRQGRALKGELEQQVSNAFSRGSTNAIVGLAFVAVLREGLETALFLLAIFQSNNGEAAATLVGALGGLAIAVLIGFAIFRAGVRVNLRRFFSVTGVVLIFVAAGLLIFAVDEFIDAGVIAKTGVLFDLGGLLPGDSNLGSLLHGLFGYVPDPTFLQGALYVLYLVPVLTLFLFGDRLPRRRQVVSA
jgi:high-affinity iron transporter